VEGREEEEATDLCAVDRDTEGTVLEGEEGRAAPLEVKEDIAAALAFVKLDGRRAWVSDESGELA
jgi:hypothetical protein